MCLICHSVRGAEVERRPTSRNADLKEREQTTRENVRLLKTQCTYLTEQSGCGVRTACNLCVSYDRTENPFRRKLRLCGSGNIYCGVEDIVIP